ncbi:alpha/beta fold hydrolase, partial [Pseudomonas syringae group genomosp. 3]
MHRLFAMAVLCFTFAATFNTASAQAQTVGATAPSPSSSESSPGGEWRNIRTQFVSTGGVYYAYRELGQNQGGTPVVFLNHLAAVLDNWDPRVVDGIAAQHHIIVFDNRGVGASTGEPAATIEQMADDAISFIKAKGYTQVDLFGFSMGGMIAQEIVLKEPQLVRKIILAGTGPA